MGLSTLVDESTTVPRELLVNHLRTVVGYFLPMAGVLDRVGLFFCFCFCSFFGGGVQLFLRRLFTTIVRGREKLQQSIDHFSKERLLLE